MHRTLPLMALLALAALATAAHADRTASSPYVDPKAPCYRWPAVDMDRDGVFDRVDHCVSTPPGCTVNEWGCHSDADGDGVCDGVDMCPATAPGTKVTESGCPEGYRAPVQETRRVPPPPPPAPQPVRETPQPTETERRLLETGTLRLDNVYFETGSAILLPESRATLDEVGLAIERHPELTLEIGGHTDTRGSARFNLSLSQARADAVRDYLLRQFRIEPSALDSRGYGETRPVTRERNEEELLRNRRVEIRVIR